MLHLPGPHLCPACNIVHAHPERRPVNSAPQSAATLRPFFATFLHIAGVSSTPYSAYCTDMSGGWGGGNGNYATLTFAGQVNTGYTFFSSANTVTVPATGLYAIGAQVHVVGSHDYQAGIRMLRNGGITINQLLGTNVCVAAVSPNNAQGADIGFSCVVLLNAGETVQVQGFQSWGVSNPTYPFFIVFVPTPDHRA